MKRCSHPNIIALLELAEFEHAGLKYGYLVERFMEGGTLDERLLKSLLNRKEVLSLGDELILAVGHIAENDLVHRDLKPANIMYPAAGSEAVVGDFGIVRDLEENIDYADLLHEWAGHAVLRRSRATQQRKSTYRLAL